jgi:hypothetical protein
MSGGTSASATVDAYWGAAWNGITPGSAVDVYDAHGLFSRALEGAKGIACWNENADRYEVLNCQSKAGAIRFRFTSDMSGGSATASIEGSDGDYWGAQQDVQDPDAAIAGITVYDPHGLFKHGKTDGYGKAIYDAIEDKYIIVEAQTKAGWILVTLDEDMGETSEGQAAASVVRYWGTQQDVLTPGSAVDVYDEDDLFANAVAGDKMVAALDAEADKYRLVSWTGKDKVLWARTQSNWENNSGGNNSRVSCKLNADGFNNAVTGDAFYVYLPRCGTELDPNVVAERNIPFFFDEGGYAICAGNYLDDKIGTVKFWSNSGTPPQGWQRMNGTNNADGTALDMRGCLIGVEDPSRTTGDPDPNSPLNDWQIGDFPGGDRRDLQHDHAAVSGGAIQYFATAGIDEIWHNGAQDALTSTALRILPVCILALIERIDNSI